MSRLLSEPVATLCQEDFTSSLDLDKILLLDRVQKRKRISQEEHGRLAQLHGFCLRIGFFRGFQKYEFNHIVMLSQVHGFCLIGVVVL